ncbi:MAG: restriction endonuclease [Actinomycetota bacterium]|nr:restriction endonuclease [Actinomycetota bacterium]
MLENAIAAYVESLGERELDIPLRALLRAQGFFDIELVHGVSEHGRDFVAKRHDDDGVLRQYSLQSKAGNIGIPQWRAVRVQLEDIRTIVLRHPMYDADLDPAMVLVTTGSFVGDGKAAAEEYARSLSERWQCDFWTGERLVRMLVGHLEAALGDRARGPLLSALGEIDEGRWDLRDLERHTRRWVPAVGEAVAPANLMEAGLVANRLVAAERLDLACACAQGIIRAHLVSASSEHPLGERTATELQAAGEFFALYAEMLWARCDGALLHPAPMVNAHQEFGFWATYPVRCLRVAEILGLLGLWRRTRARDATGIAEWLAGFLARQPGAAHPISDRHGLSLIPPAIFLGPSAHDVLAAWLRNVVRWVADRYEGESLGLAGIDADPAVEIEYLLGDLEHIERPRRRESFVAGVVLDLASVLELDELFDDARHEFLAVELVAELRYPPGESDAWLRDARGLRQELNPPYAERYAETPSWLTAPHHYRTADDLWPVAVGLEWEALATWSLLRDRFDGVLLRSIVDHQGA